MQILSDWKKANKLTDAKAAAVLGISRGHFNKLLNNHGTLSVPLLIRMHFATGQSVDELLRPQISKARSKPDIAKLAAYRPQSPKPSGAVA